MPAAIIPPQNLLDRANVGGGDYVSVGQLQLRNFVEYGGLRPHHRVLDVGCGIGRMATALLDYLDDRGSYEGFDVVPESVHWCQANVAPRRPSFRFRVTDVRNDTYRPDCPTPASRYRFPYPGREFDFVFLTSVFTHVLPDVLTNYLREIHRVLKPDGHCFITLLLLNDDSREGIRAGRSALQFPHRRGMCYVEDDRHPENVVGYDESYVRGRLRRAGLDAVGWYYRNGQDIVVARRGERASGWWSRLTWWVPTSGRW
jgi:SAM-dependent methyltransferase